VSRFLRGAGISPLSGNFCLFLFCFTRQLKSPGKGWFHTSSDSRDELLLRGIIGSVTMRAFQKRSPLEAGAFSRRSMQLFVAMTTAALKQVLKTQRLARGCDPRRKQEAKRTELTTALIQPSALEGSKCVKPATYTAQHLCVFHQRAKLTNFSFLFFFQIKSLKLPTTQFLHRIVWTQNNTLKTLRKSPTSSRLGYNQWRCKPKILGATSFFYMSINALFGIPSLKAQND